MNKRLSARALAGACVLSVCVLTTSAQENPGEINNQSPTVQLDEVLVTGEQPGPGLWKVSKDDHALWIIGTYSPLPKKMTWRSKQVEELVAESQEVLAPARIDVDTNIGIFRAITLIPTALGAAKNPNDAQLKDVVPPDVYARWLVLKEKYIGRDKGIEKERPTFAAQELRNKVFAKSGLQSGYMVWPIVAKIAKQHKVRITTPEVKAKLQIEEPRAALKKFRRTDLPDVECFAKTLDGVEPEIEAMKLRANAWSIGDVDALRRLAKTDQSDDCMQVLQTAMMTGQLADQLGAQETVQNYKREMERATKEAEQKWLAAAQSALAKNRTTFAALPIREILRTDGYLTKLRTLGYSIEEP